MLLLGGSDDDNLFQWTGSRLTEQLDLLKSVGGNYIRNTIYIKNKAAEAGVEVHTTEMWDDYDLLQAFSIRWYDIDHGRWKPTEGSRAERSLRLKTPNDGQWAVIVLKSKQR